MRVAITGGTGFVGRNVAAQLPTEDTVIISRRSGIDLDNVAKLTEALTGCDVVVHSAGINREIGDQTYQRVHVEGTINMLADAEQAGVKKIVMMSFLNARPDSGSAYHETKWIAEELIRSSGLDYTILKSGMVYGKGDHMIDHISHALYTFPVFGTVGWSKNVTSKTIKPIPVQELVKVILAAADGELSRETVEVVGGEELLLTEAVKRIAKVVDRPARIIPLPVLFHKGLTNVAEATMKVPLVAKTQLRMLTEGISYSYGGKQLPEHLQPKLGFSEELIRESLPEPGRFTFDDLLVSEKFVKRHT